MKEDEDQRIRALYKYWKTTNAEIEEFIDRRYSERLIGCIENLTNKSCNLPKKKIKQQIKDMISAKHAQIAIRNAKLQVIKKS